MGAGPAATTARMQIEPQTSTPSHLLPPVAACPNQRAARRIAKIIPSTEPAPRTQALQGGARHRCGRRRTAELEKLLALAGCAECRGCVKLSSTRCALKCATCAL